MNMKLGTELTPADQARVLASYVHRYTCEHVPGWAHGRKPNGEPYRPQFRTDAEWLANTRFAVCNDGRIDGRAKSCQTSGQTWPEGK